MEKQGEDMRKSGRRGRIYWWTLSALVVGFALYFSFYSIGRHHALRSSAFDLGIFDQLVWNVAHGHSLVYTIESVSNRWLVHQEPILYLVALPYLLAPRAETLLVIQAVIVAASAIPLYLIVRRWTDGRPWVGLLIVLAYFLSPALEGVVVSDFHETALAPLFLLGALYFLEERRLALAATALLFALACKEDVALTVAAVGLGTLLRRKDLRLVGTIVCVSGGAIYLLTLFATQARLAAVRDLFLWRYPEWVWPPARLLMTFWSDPRLVLSHIFAPPKVTYLAWLLIPFGFLPLLCPILTLMALPTVVINLFSIFPTHYAFDSWHYNATVAPFLALAGGKVISVALQRASHWWRSLSVLAMVLLVAGSGLAHYMYGYTPLAADFAFPTGGRHYQVVREAVSLVPPDAAVSAQSTLVPHLSGRSVIYEYPKGVETVDYVVLDVSAAYYTFPNTAEYEASIERLFGDGAFGLKYARDGLLVFQRGAAHTVTLGDDFYTYMVVDGVEEKGDHPAISFGPIELVDASFELLRRGRMEGTLHWRAREAIPPTLRPAIALGREKGELIAIHLQDLPFRHQMRPWQAGEIYRLTTGVSTGDGVCGSRWVYYAGVWDEAAGVWLNPRLGENAGYSVLNVVVDGRETHWVPLVVVEDCFGKLSEHESAPKSPY